MCEDLVYNVDMVCKICGERKGTLELMDMDC